MKLQNTVPEQITHDAIKGSFGDVTYFLTTLDLRDAAENLQLFPQDKLSFRERIQRVLNEDRVKNEILPYLLQDKDRFFNSLVCILLPDANQAEGYWDFRPYEDEAGNPLRVGSFKIAKRVARVVLDGQHRFRALSLYWERAQEELDGLSKTMDIPVAYVVIDSLGQMGVRGQDFRTKTTEAARHLFAVLNKNAKLVDRTTLLLIDDSDITNVIARRVIEDKLIDEHLVKWYVGDNLNPSDPYFTTLNTIRELVRALLHNKQPEWETAEVLTNQTHVLARLYTEGIFPTFSLKEAIKMIFANWTCYADWQELLESTGVEVSQQPSESRITPAAKLKLSNVRKASLCFTVAGQRAILSGLAQAFLTGRSHSKAALLLLLDRINILYANNVFGRKPSKDSHNVFYSVLFDQAGRMIYARAPVELASKIIAVSLGAAHDRPSIASEFNGMTNLSPTLLDAHWARCDALFIKAEKNK